MYSDFIRFVVTAGRRHPAPGSERRPSKHNLVFYYIFLNPNRKPNPVQAAGVYSLQKSGFLATGSRNLPQCLQALRRTLRRGLFFAAGAAQRRLRGPQRYPLGARRSSTTEMRRTRCDELSCDSGRVMNFHASRKNTVADPSGATSSSPHELTRTSRAGDLRVSERPSQIADVERQSR